MKIDEAIKELKSCNPLTGDDKNDSKHFEAVDMAIEALERTRWIPVSERLPTREDAGPSGDVLCYDAEEKFQLPCGWLTVGKLEYVSHWMPLPEPPDQEV